MAEKNAQEAIAREAQIKSDADNALLENLSAVQELLCGKGYRVDLKCIREIIGTW